MARWTLRGLFGHSREIDENTWDGLEDALILADFGADASERLVQELRDQVERLHLRDERELRGLLRDAVAEELAGNDPTLHLRRPETPDGRPLPAVVLVVGVNGVGKTTTIGKLARFLTRLGRTVVVGAADTFRAAAVEQLATWAERGGADIVRPERPGQDPASVAYQAVAKAVADNADVVLIDTAGRLQTKSGLMDELTKIRRVIEKQAPIAEVLLVLDATTGSNGIVQARAFLDHAGATGIVLTKLDGSAKGGFVVGVREEAGIPVKLVGTGEGIDDLQAFNAETFAREMVD
jgi:fused signal recognition particle receptor